MGDQHHLRSARSICRERESSGALGDRAQSWRQLLDDPSVRDAHTSSSPARQVAVVGHQQHRLALVDQARQTARTSPRWSANRGCPVGSSAASNSGSFARARAIATRCRCPPETADGSLSACSAMPTRSSRCSARSRRSPRPAVQAGKVHRHHHVLRARQHGQQLEELEHHAHVLSAPGRRSDPRSSLSTARSPIMDLAAPSAGRCR